jgi:hypothetical protein
MVFLAAGVFACSGGGGSTTSGSGDQLNSNSGGGGTFLCTALGTNNTTFVTLESDKITVVQEGSSIQTGKLQDGASGGVKTFASWSPTKGFLSADDTIDVTAALESTGSGELDLRTKNVGPYWKGDCHKATQEQLDADQCLPLAQDIYPVDSEAKAKIAKSGSRYTITISDSKAGDYVYDVSSKRTGLLCVLGKAKPVSCAAIVADATSSKAYSNGASSGSPAVEKVSDTEWNTWQIDDESGDQYFKVTTDNASDGCKVESVTKDSAH